LRLQTPANPVAHHSEPSDITQPTILLDNISKLFGRFAALRAITLQFLPSRIYLLVGENGAGKSTLLRIVAGLAPPSSGTIHVRGSIGYMAHASMLYDELSGMENLRYFATLSGVPSSRCAEMMRALALDPALARATRDYSQGMRQRLSLARAALHKPDILLLDEPFSNVDSASARQMVSLLVSWRSEGRTMIVVTHQPALLHEVADEFVRLEAGALSPVQGTIREVRA
jgi:ABC-type multidrug transport system ATPase subunit